MKKLPGAAAAAFVLVAGAASASTATVKVGEDANAFQCMIVINSGSDADHGVSGDILLNGYAAECGFYGAGFVGKAALARKFGGPNVAVLSGYSDKSKQTYGYQDIEVILQLTNGSLADRNKFLVYGIRAYDDGSPVFLGEGKYHYAP